MGRIKLCKWGNNYRHGENKVMQWGNDYRQKRIKSKIPTQLDKQHYT